MTQILTMLRAQVLAVLAAVAIGPAAAQEPTAVTLMLNWTPNNHHAGIYLALANGWYADAGIALEVIEAAAAGADQVVGAGRADFGISQAESVIPARANGVPVVSIATILRFNDSSLMALTADGIARPRDLAGKTYGGYGGSLERELIDALVACDGGGRTEPDLLDELGVETGVESHRVRRPRRRARGWRLSGDRQNQPEACGHQLEHSEGSSRMKRA